MKLTQAQWPSRLHCQLQLALTPAVAALAVLAMPVAHADTYSLDAQVVSFRSWVDAGNAGLNGGVNGTALSDSGVFAGTNEFGASYNWSTTVYFGQGTQSIDFGYDPAKLPTRRMNNFSVSAAQATVTPSPLPNSNFDLAKLSFTNGQWFFKAEVGVAFLAHDLTTGVNNTYYDTVLITSNSTTPNPITHLFNPITEADMFVLEGHPEFGSVRVYEAVAQPAGNPGVTGGGILQAHIGSLDPVGYSAAYGAAFLDTSVTAIPNTPAVPEPESYAMFLAGLGLIGATRLCRPMKQARPLATA